MTDVLVFEDSLPRVAGDLARRKGVRAVCWHRDGRLTVDGATVAARGVRPEVGWISFDVFMQGQMAPFVDALAGFDHLRWVQTAHAGVDSPLYVPLARAGVRLSKSWAQSIPIAEYVLAHALHLRQDIDARREAQRMREWRYAHFGELYRSTWLLVGFGHIGRRVAERARAFGCRIATLRRSQAPDPAADEIVTRADLPTALGRTDVVVLACPQTAETTGLVDAAFVGAMREGSLLVNVARGGLVDDAALLAGLARNRPGAAVLDVFNEEPLPPEHPYWTHPRVTVTAHTSNAGEGTVDRGTEQFLENLERYLRGEAVTDEVDNRSLLAMG